MKIDSVILRAILVPYVILTIIGSVFYVSSTYLNLIPSSDLITLNIAVLTASSIFFGFAVQSFARFSDKLADLKRRISDMGKELCELYEIVKKDKELSTKKIFYDEKAGVFEGIGLNGYQGDPLKVIKDAYNTVIYLLMWKLRHLYRGFIIAYQIIPVGLLFGSVIASLFSFANSSAHVALSIALTLLLLTIGFISLGWYYSSRRLNRYDDSLFNIRQQILGELSAILPQAYKPNNYKWKRES